jgi:tRNA(Ile)-lysidine synthase
MARLSRLDPAVAATRVAVREVLRDIIAEASVPAVPPAAQPLVLIALSGGADSLALAAAAAFEASKVEVRVGAIIVDHGLQAESERVAERAATQARQLGLSPVLVRRVSVRSAVTRGDGYEGGPEAAARAARYEAFDAVRAETGAVAVLTAHTRDDQAEQVLLALARGSGIRAIAGIPPRREAMYRPFLQITREQTEAACQAQQLAVWRDPHNSDTVFARVRVREQVIPMLEQELGTGIAANLARTAELAREDADTLDALAAHLLDVLLRRREDGGFELPVRDLIEQPPALRNRIVRALGRDQFGSHLTRDHTLTIAALVTHWRGQGPIHVPQMVVQRAEGSLIFRTRE